MQSHQRPLILCSNDDGIDSPLLLGLAEALAAFADVVVVAPERQRSAASHAITLHKPLRLKEVAPRQYSLSGSPADAVYVGMVSILQTKPALVISGINHGLNLSSDVHYSGTVAAAREGALRGSVGLALSMEPRGDRAFAIASATEIAKQVLAAKCSASTLFNINIPALVAHEQLKWTVLGQRRYVEDVGQRTDPMGRPYMWIGGGAVGHEPVDNGDCDAVAAGYISATALLVDCSIASTLAAPPF
jgi:5'-nucleotidase